MKSLSGDSDRILCLVNFFLDFLLPLGGGKAGWGGGGMSFSWTMDSFLTVTFLGAAGVVVDAGGGALVVGGGDGGATYEN